MWVPILLQCICMVIIGWNCRDFRECRIMTYAYLVGSIGQFLSELIARSI